MMNLHETVYCLLIALSENVCTFCAKIPLCFVSGAGPAFTVGETQRMLYAPSYL